MGPCLCGDTCCPSCGPAQGNWHCPICGQWASEGCEHIDEETGDLKPEYQEQAAAIKSAERAAEQAMCEEWREDARLAEEFWASWAPESTMSREQIERLAHE